VQGFELYRNEHDPCGKRAKGTVLIRETHPPKTKKPKINRRKKKKKKKKRKYLEDRKMCRKRNRIEGSDSHGIQNFCTPLLSPSLFSLSLCLYSSADDSEFVVAAREFGNRTWKD
jgi:hypothetical protein